MTEAEYLTGQRPGLLLAHLRGRVRGTPAAKARRWRLLAVAFAREVRLPGGWDDVRRLVGHIEAVAEGVARLADAWSIADWSDDTRHEGRYVSNWAQLCRELCRSEAYLSAYGAGGVVSNGFFPAEMLSADGRCGELIREVFGNPFRPVAFDPAWRTPTVLALAGPAYADQAFDRLPILADALEDAGCDAADLLAHLRGPGPHVRGCSALDLVLGKG